MGVDRFRGEVAEHGCIGEHFWIVGGTPHGTTWMIDRDPATLLEVIDRLPGSLYGWVIDQTMAALDDPLRTIKDASAREGAPDTDEDAMDEKEFAEVRELVLELMRLVHASDVVAARLGLDGQAGGLGGKAALEGIRSSAAA